MLTPFITARVSPFLSATNTGIGNVLFQIASTIGIGKTLNKKVVFPFVHELSRKLLINYGYDHGTRLYRNILNEPIELPMQQMIIELSNNGKRVDNNLYSPISDNHITPIYGYLESPCYFNECVDEIRTMFSPDEEAIDELHSKYPILNENVETISIHMCIYDGNPNEHYRLANSAPLKYYKNAILKLKKENQVYFVFSNNIPQARIDLESFNLNINFIFVTDQIDYMDLWLMSLCKHHILSYSTFCWWGAFLATHPEKRVIYSKANYDILKNMGLSHDEITSKYFYSNYECVK